MTTKLLSYELKAATSGGAAARRGDARGSRGFGGRSRRNSLQLAALDSDRPAQLREIDLVYGFRAMVPVRDERAIREHETRERSTPERCSKKNTENEPRHIDSSII